MSKTSAAHQQLLTKPFDVLLPYQKRWVADRSRFKIWMKSRQIGGSFSTAAEVVSDCLVQSNTKWVVLSTGERQALEWMEKAKLWSDAFGKAVEGYEELRQSTEALLKQAEIRYSNGSSIIAVPANPRTIRGYSANLLCDEFGHQERPSEIWKAIVPSITNPLSGEKRVRIISTPNGKDNKFYDLWAHNKRYSHHKTDIYEAVKQGLPVNIDELREAIGDEETWQQEYMCEFLQSSSILLSYEMIEACEDLTCGSGVFSPEARSHYLGVDIGRRHDLTVIWILEDRSAYMHTVGVIVLKNMPFRQQILEVSALLDIPTVQRCFVDCTGIGAGMAEELATLYGPRVEEFWFTQATKNEICIGMQKAFEAGSIHVPIDRKIREDLHSLQRVTNSTGSVSYRAPRSEDGHADRATALALALAAARAAKDGGSCSVGRVGGPQSNRVLDMFEAAFNRDREREDIML